MSLGFPALPGFYCLVFLYLEPLSTFGPGISAWISQGVSWFYHAQIPSGSPVPDSLDERSRLVVVHLLNCYFLFGLISTIVFRAIRDTLPNNPIAQERLVGACLSALAIADVTHVLETFLCLPESLRYDPLAWNVMIHGNITITSLLFLTRISWFLGIGRTRFYFGQRLNQHVKSN